MREIKFRAWDKDDKQMWSAQDLVDNEHYLYANGQIEFVLLRYEDKVFKTDEFELMQYTGLKDKNGKEIYEGDVIGRKGFLNWVVSDNGVNLVKKFIHNTDEYPLDKYSVDREYDFVVGNIYENPDLLNET